MPSEIELRFEKTVVEIVNEPACPDAALLSRIRSAAAARARNKRKSLLLAAACAVLLINAALSYKLAARAVESAGGGWAAVVAAVAGLMLALLPCVPLLTVDDLARKPLK